MAERRPTGAMGQIPRWLLKCGAPPTSLVMKSWYLEGVVRKQSGPHDGWGGAWTCEWPWTRKKVFSFLYSISVHLGRSWEGGSSTERKLTLAKLVHAWMKARQLCSFCSNTLPVCAVPMGGQLNPLRSLNLPTPGSQTFGFLYLPPELRMIASLNMSSFLLAPSAQAEDVLSCQLLTTTRWPLWSMSTWPGYRTRHPLCLLYPQCLMWLQLKEPVLLSVSQVGILPPVIVLVGGPPHIDP